MKQLQPTKPLSFDVFVLFCDGVAFAVGEQLILRGDFREVEMFIREEMIAVCHCEEQALIEIRDAEGKVIHPFALKGRHLMLSPCFFNKGYDLWIENKKMMSLDLDYWCSYVGDCHSVLN